MLIRRPIVASADANRSDAAQGQTSRQGADLLEGGAHFFLVPSRTSRKACVDSKAFDVMAVSFQTPAHNQSRMEQGVVRIFVRLWAPGPTESDPARKQYGTHQFDPARKIRRDTPIVVEIRALRNPSLADRSFCVCVWVFTKKPISYTPLSPSSTPAKCPVYAQAWAVLMLPSSPCRSCVGPAAALAAHPQWQMLGSPHLSLTMFGHVRLFAAICRHLFDHFWPCLAMF